MKQRDLAVAAAAVSEFEAEAKAAILRDEGIEAIVTRNAPSWTGHASISPTATGAFVLVHREDLERAQQALRQQVADSVDLDWDEIDVGEREDDLPLGEPGRMPVLAMIAFAVAAALVIVSVIVGLVLALA